MLISVGFPPAVYARVNERNSSQRFSDSTQKCDLTDLAGIAGNHHARSSKSQ